MRSGVLRRLLCRALFPMSALHVLCQAQSGLFVFWVSCRASVQVQLLRSAVGKGGRGWLLQCLLHCGVLLAPNLLLYAHCMLHSEAERQVIVCGLQIGSKARSLIFKPSKEVAGLAWLRTKRMQRCWTMHGCQHQRIKIKSLCHWPSTPETVASSVLELQAGDGRAGACKELPALGSIAVLPRVARICGHVQPKGAALQTVQAGHHR